MQTRFKIRVLIAILFVGTMHSCRSREFGVKSFEKSTTPEGNTDEKGCSEKKWNVTYGDKPTRVYHWTDWPTAATNPQEYIESMFKMLGEKQKAGTNCGLAGCGMYASQDPYQTPSYGKTLVQFDIKAATRFSDEGGNLFRKNRFDSVKSECSGIVFKYGSAIENHEAAVNKKRGAEKRELAISIFDPNVIDLQSVKSFDFKSIGKLKHEVAGVKRLMTSTGFRASFEYELTALDAGISNLKADSAAVRKAFISEHIHQCFSELPPPKFPESMPAEEVEILKHEISRLVYKLKSGVTSSRPRLIESDCISLKAPLLEQLKLFLESCGRKLNISPNAKSLTCEEIYPLVDNAKPSQADLEPFVREMQKFWSSEFTYLEQQYTFADWKTITKITDQ